LAQARKRLAWVLRQAQVPGRMPAELLLVVEAAGHPARAPLPRSPEKPPMKST